jgi:hypothetical protein
MSQIRCPMCGHLCVNKIDFGSHIRRCKEANSKFDFKSKRRSKPKSKNKRRN